jgi:hypothetical protein
LLIGAGVVLARSVWLEQRASDTARQAAPGEESAEIQIKALPLWAISDMGSRIRLHAVTDARVRNNSSAVNPHLALRLIRTAPPQVNCNSHGWVFTGGRFWLLSADIERILVDNCYQPVSDPVAGDLVIYRDSAGTITHSACVRAATPDGLILVEGQWGPLGRFLHAPEDQLFGDRWTFYHSDRKGHLLDGLDESTPDPKPEPRQPHL